MSDGITHAELVQRSVAWLKRNGCRVVLHDPFRTPLYEQPDAIGWRDGLSIVVEAKISLADYRVDAKKPWRANPSLGMGDWRFFITPQGLLDGIDLPAGWGLIECLGRSTRVARGGPAGNYWWGAIPFGTSDKRAETRMLVSALAQPSARPRPGLMPRRGLDVAAWLGDTEQEHCNE